MKRQHEKHVCLAAEKKLQDKGWYNGKEDKCDDPRTQLPVGQSATLVDPPDVFTPGSSRFSAERDPSQPPNWAWTIVHKGERHITRKLYPTVPGPHGNEWVSTILGVAESDPTGVYDRVDFSSWLTFHQMFQVTTPLFIAIRITIHTLGKEGLGMTGSWSTGLLAYEFMNRLLVFC